MKYVNLKLNTGMKDCSAMNQTVRLQILSNNTIMRDRIMYKLSVLFGGATASGKMYGGWIDDNNNYVTDEVVIITSYASYKTLNAGKQALIDICKYYLMESQEQCIILKVNDIAYYIDIETQLYPEMSYIKSKYNQ